MSEISLEQRRFLIEAYFSTKKSFSSTQRRFCTKYAIKKKQKAPSLQLIRSIVQKFEKSGCVDICHNKGRGCSFLIKEKLDATFCQMAKGDDHVTVRKLADKTSCSAITAYKFLTKDLRLFPYKISIGHVLTEQHKRSRYLFSQWLLKRIEEEPNFLGSIVWTRKSSEL